jgi:hypothetical protein
VSSADETTGSESVGTSTLIRIGVARLTSVASETGHEPLLDRVLPY